MAYKVEYSFKSGKRRVHESDIRYAFRAQDAVDDIRSFHKQTRIEAVYKSDGSLWEYCHEDWS